MNAKQFQSHFLRLIALTWLLPPMVGFAFLLYIEIFTFDQVIQMMSTPLKPIFLGGGFFAALVYFRSYSKSLSIYLDTPSNTHRLLTERAMKRFPLHYWVFFIGYISLAPTAAILSLEMSSNYVALPVDWFRVHLVALIVSIIVGLPIFIRIYDLFGRAFGQIQLKRPIITIKTKVFLIGALIPLLIDTMLVQYYWTRTGFFNTETFFIWLLLEALAVMGALLFVRSFTQSLSPLQRLITSPQDAQRKPIQPASTDELGIFANQLAVLLDEQHLHRQRLSFSNDLLKASHSYESLAKLLETIVNRTCQTLHGDICFLSLYDHKKDQLVCVANSNDGYNAEGHYQIDADATSLNMDTFRRSKTTVTDNVPGNPRSNQQLVNTYNIKSSAAVPMIANKRTIGVLQIVCTQQPYSYHEHEIKILQAYAQETAVIQTFFDELKQRHKAESAITQIMEAVSTTTGSDFFSAITRHMAEILQADACAVVATIADSPDIVEALAYFHAGKISSNIRYSLRGGPCETIIGQQAHTYACNLQEIFPEDDSLKKAGMQSYVGIPLFNTQKQPLGLLFAMFRDTIEDVEFNESVMRIFGTRTASEIERSQTEDRIKRMAYYDVLTQLPNRAYLLDRLQHDIAHAHRHHTRLAVMMMDLDHFKNINDSLGHPVGDGLLVEVAQRLQKCVREEDTVARLGGDEFIILQADFSNRESAINHVNRIIKNLYKTLKGHYLIADHTLMITSSCGIAIYPDDGDSAEQLIKHADTALYKAKALGRDNYQFFSHDMNVAAMERLEMESAIHHGIEKKQFEAAYQPKVSVADNRIIGAEILMRWPHPEQGYISPERFIPVADETGQIIQLGEFIFKEACIQTSKLWCNTHCCDEVYSLSVNVSPRQFQQDDFIDKIKQYLKKFKTNPHCIELEVTENILIEDTEKVREKLLAIKALGLKISIDDFGTGYASLRYLQQLPIDIIKIDRSFITHINTNPSDLAIVKTIMSMAKNLNIKVIAEGVETADQLDTLKQLGCEFYQGYYFSKPVKKEEFQAMLEKQRSNTL